MCWFFWVVFSVAQETDTSLYRPALEELRRQIRSSTTSMTSVPKPLKFLRPHYAKLKEIYQNMAPGENKVCLRHQLNGSDDLIRTISLCLCVNPSLFDSISVPTWCLSSPWPWAPSGSVWSIVCWAHRRSSRHGDTNTSGTRTSTSTARRQPEDQCCYC